MRNQYELKELSRWWMDISKIIFASLVAKLLENGGPKFESGSILIAILGLTTSVVCMPILLRFATF